MSLSKNPWEISEQDFPYAGDIEDQLRFLLRFAILAPSARNSQPWFFRVRGNRVLLLADLARSQPVSDPNRRELYIALGCALENLLVAAEHLGFEHSVAYFPRPGQQDLAAMIAFRPGGTVSPARSGTTLDAIRRRRNEAGLFNSTPVPAHLQQRLTGCCIEPDLVVNLSEDILFHRWIDTLTMASDRADLGNPAFRMELQYWRSLSVFGSRLEEGMASNGKLPMNREAVAVLDHLKVESAPVIGLIRGAGDTHFIQLKTGQVFERIWLTATALGVSINPMSQTMRRPELRSAVRELMPSVGWVPQHLFRVGYSGNDPEPRAPRRPLEEVLL
jgi:nitroreductase